MFRDSSAANGAFAAMFVTPSSGVIFEWRSTDGGSASSTTVASVAAPVWLRLNQTDGQFSGYYSTNGTTWTQVGTSQNVTVGVSDLAGLAATSHASGTSTTAVIDNVSVIAAPTVATPASANPSPVTSTSTNLSVLGADPTGEANLTYTWATTGTPPAPVNFSPNGANGTNAAKNIAATFTEAGFYNFMVTITNAGGLSVTSSVGVTINQTYSSMSISPSAPNLTGGSTQQFTATALDQFGQALASQPSITWTLLSGPGTLDSGGLYTPPNASGSAVVQAASGAYSAAANVTFSSEAQWNGTSDLSWNTGGNWIDAFTSGTLAAPGVRGLTGDTVLFATAPLARLDGATPTLAAVTFNNAATGYGIIQGSGGSLTLQGGLAGAGATVSVLAGNPAIDAPLHLASNTMFSAAASTTLAMMGAIDGSGSLTMTGSGKLYLSGSNSYTGGTAVAGGSLIVSSATALPDGGNLVVGDNSLFASPVVAPSQPGTTVDGSPSPAARSATAPIGNATASNAVVRAPVSAATPVSSIIRRGGLKPNRARISALTQFWIEQRQRQPAGPAKARAVDIVMMTRNS